jgi:hypothetical protein
MWTTALTRLPAGLSTRVQRWVALAILAADVVLVAGLAAEGTVLAKPGGLRYVIAALAGLAVYAAAVTVLTARGQPWVNTARQTGVALGAVTAAMWLLSLAIETFAGLTPRLNLAATGPLLLGGFALWGLAGALARRRTGTLRAGVLAAVSAAMTCVTINLVFGLSLPYLALPRLVHNIDGSPEYLRNGWHDLHAFAIANTLDAGFMLLLVAPAIATVVGTLAALAAGLRRRQTLDTP